MKLWRCAEIISQVVGDELLLLEQDQGKLHHLNSTAAWIYERCDGRTSDAIAAELSRSYGVNRSVADRDLDAIADQLSQLGLIQRADRPQGAEGD
jgi:hypothetical protein